MACCSNDRPAPWQCTYVCVSYEKPRVVIGRTYTTPYLGDVQNGAPVANGNHMGAPDSNGHSAAEASHGATASSAEALAGAAGQRQGSSEHADSRPNGGAGLRWQRSEQQIDRSALMTRDPILFYDDVPLHVSELDDNGISQLTVKVRVFLSTFNHAGTLPTTHCLTVSRHLT